jgi:3-methylcrotonyl-CoA carboxylase alpha subunit
VRSDWIDGDRARAVEVAALGGDRYRVTIDDVPLELEAHFERDGRIVLAHGASTVTAEITAVGARRFVRLGHADFVLDRGSPRRSARGGRSAEARLESPMPGIVTKVLVAPGDPVRKGQPLVAVEAMKMEHLIRAPRDGRVRELRARAGEMVAGGIPLVELDGGET